MLKKYLNIQFYKINYQDGVLLYLADKMGRKLINILSKQGKHVADG